VSMPWESDAISVAEGQSYRLVATAAPRDDTRSDAASTPTTAGVLGVPTPLENAPTSSPTNWSTTSRDRDSPPCRRRRSVCACTCVNARGSESQSCCCGEQSRCRLQDRRRQGGRSFGGLAPSGGDVIAVLFLFLGVALFLWPNAPTCTPGASSAGKQPAR
jgi:hypothetical protein